ncbi:MAG: Do family serine endopeptidase [Saprospiraceae bacterium]
MIRSWKTISLLACFGLLTSSASVMLYKYLESPQQVIIREVKSLRSADWEPARAAETSNLLPHGMAPNSFSYAALKATPGVVYITSSGNMPIPGYKNAFFKSSAGSGVIISADGLIVTNNHVVDKNDKIVVQLNDRREYTATIIGTDPSTDIALIKIDAKDLPFLSFGDSDSLLLGDWVLAVGNPLQLESTVTAGIVSAKSRNINILDSKTPIEAFIQTDAVVNPGNSGGALVNTNGDLVGVNTAIMTQTGSYEGYSFAVPSNLVRKVITDLKEFGSVQRGLLGVGIENITANLAKELNISICSGVYVNRVNPNSSASEAGLKRGDIILNINGSEVNSFPELQEIIGRYRPGNLIEIDYIRAGVALKTNVVLKNQLNTTEIVQIRDDIELQNLGVELRELTPMEREKYKTEGILVLSVTKGSTIDEANLVPGFVITKVNHQPIASVDDFLRVIASAKKNLFLEGKYSNISDPYYYQLDKN